MLPPHGEPMTASARFGIVPAAGVGSRLSPYRAPKELIQIGYRPVDGRLLDRKSTRLNSSHRP